jgi:hypothetical protein
MKPKKKAQKPKKQVKKQAPIPKKQKPKKKQLTPNQKQKNKKINNKLSNIYRDRKKVLNEIENYLYTNPNKKIKTAIGNKDKKETTKKVGTVVNSLSTKIRNFNTKIENLKSKKVTLKKIKVKKEKKEVFEETGLMEVLEFSGWDGKEIFTYINDKAIKTVVNADTGELFKKYKQKTDLIKEINTILISMASEDIFKLYVYVNYIEFEVIKNGFKK